MTHGDLDSSKMNKARRWHVLAEVDDLTHFGTFPTDLEDEKRLICSTSVLALDNYATLTIK